MSLIHRVRSFYEGMPDVLRIPVGATARLLPEKMRYGSAFGHARREASSAHTMGEEALESAVIAKLRAYLSAVSSAPYCRRILSEAGLDLATARPEDLAVLPTCTKADITAQVDDFTAAVPPSGRKWVTTGGTTGEPFGFWLERDASPIDWAYTVDAWGRAGFELDDPRLVLRGVRLGTGATRRLWRYEPIRRELYVSVFDLDEEHLPLIRAKIDSFKPRFIHGYPSALESLGASYESSGEPPPKVEALLLVSENIYPGQRERLERYFDARTFSFYGMSEKVAFAAECEHSAELHVEPLYGVVELLDEELRPIAEPGVVGEIVATGFVNRAMALVRYRTGDYAAWAPGECRCGRRMRRLDAVRGRWTQEYLVGASGARVSMTALNVHDAVTGGMRRFQIVQTEPGRALVRIERMPGAGCDVPAGFIAALESKLRGQVELEVEMVDSLPPTVRGKHRYIVQKVRS